MKKALLVLALSAAAHGATYEKNLYPQRGHVEMYQCEPGVKATFNVWTTDRATLALKNFKLGTSCGKLNVEARTYVLKLKSKRTGNLWVGSLPDGRGVRVYDYRNGAGPNVRVASPFVVEEYNAKGVLIQSLYPAIGAQG